MNTITIYIFFLSRIYISLHTLKILTLRWWLCSVPVQPCPRFEPLSSCRPPGCCGWRTPPRWCFCSPGWTHFSWNGTAGYSSPHLSLRWVRLQENQKQRNLVAHCHGRDQSKCWLVFPFYSLRWQNLIRLCPAGSHAGRSCQNLLSGKSDSTVSQGLCSWVCCYASSLSPNCHNGLSELFNHWKPLIHTFNVLTLDRWCIPAFSFPIHSIAWEVTIEISNLNMRSDTSDLCYLCDLCCDRVLEHTNTLKSRFPFRKKFHTQLKMTRFRKLNSKV